MLVEILVSLSELAVNPEPPLPSLGAGQKKRPARL